MGFDSAIEGTSSTWNWNIVSGFSRVSRGGAMSAV